MPFPKIYINPMCFLFFVIPPIVLFTLHDMTFKYWYLFSRNLTEKESVARKRYSNSVKVQDSIVEEKISFSQCARNIWANLMKKTPKSVLEIAKKMETNSVYIDSHDEVIEGMENHNLSSSSSSSDEIPEFLRPKPLNISYAPQPNVMIIDGTGAIIGSVPPSTFTPSTPAVESDFMKRFNALKFAQQNQESQNAQPIFSHSSEGQIIEEKFSRKYQERLEKEETEIGSDSNFSLNNNEEIEEKYENKESEEELEGEKEKERNEKENFLNESF